MITSLEKLRGFVEGFALRLVQDLHQIFFFYLGSGIAKDSVIFAKDLGWIRAHHYRVLLFGSSGDS